MRQPDGGGFRAGGGVTALLPPAGWSSVELGIKMEMGCLIGLVKVSNKVLEGVSIFLLVAMTVIVVLQILFRYLLHNPLMWAEELAALAFVWMGLLGSALAVRDRALIQVDYFADRFPQKVRRWLDRTVVLSLAAFSLVIIRVGFAFTRMQEGMSSQSLGIQYRFFSLAVPVGFILMVLYIVQDIRPGSGDTSRQ